MNKSNKDYLYKLLSVPSPSGFESKAQKITKEYLRGTCDDISSDINGNLIAFKRGSGDLKVMIVGHADEIGFMVNYIDENGYIYLKPLGGFDVNLLPGLRLNIYHEDKVVRGIIGKNAPHMSRGDSESPKLKMEDIWVDIGAKDRKDAEKRVSIGDIVNFHSEIEELAENVIVSKATDNKVGVYIASAVMKALANTKLVANYFAVSSVGEETTMKGARTSSFKIEPDIAIAVDVTFTSDVPGADKRKFGDVKLGKGPALALGAAVHPAVNQHLQELAKKHKIPLQLEISPSHTGTDADAIHAQRTGVATAVLSIPNRYMHSPNEIVHLEDLDNAVKLLTEFIKSLSDKFDLSR
jgi:endoglucanase